MELILVDDGSTDTTHKIMQEYKNRYSGKKIKVIQQEHSGLAQGRCTGVKNSEGNYITFIDADDYLLEGAYSTIIQYISDYKADK